MARDLRIGRILFPTLSDDLSEPAGGALDQVGAVIVGGERQVRAMKLTVPLHGEAGDADSYDVGPRLRRQVRALLSNPDARLQGLYMAFDIDDEINGWLIIGEGDINYAQGGPSLGEFELVLSDVYRVATPSSHRPARRVELYDRRLATTARDIRGTVFGTWFSGFGAQARGWLPSGADDLAIGYRPGAVQARTTLDGAVLPAVTTSQFPSLAHGSVISFEQPETAHGLGDVVVLDRRGQGMPASSSLDGDNDPQRVYGWEEVYGPEYRLTPGDLPVLQNGLCRIRFTTVSGAPVLLLDEAVVGTGYVERGALSFWHETASTFTLLDTLHEGSQTVVEWTPEKAVVRFAARKTAGVDARADIYITLERGVRGPRIECYLLDETGAETGAAIQYDPFASGDQGLLKGSPTALGSLKVATEGWNNVDQGAFTGLEPWAAMIGPTAGAGALEIAVLRDPVHLYTIDSTFAYGATRRAVRVWARDQDTAVDGYVSAHLAFGPPGFTVEAEAKRFASGTTSQVADGAASSGQTVQDTQTAATADTLRIVDAGQNDGVTPATYAIWVRVRVGTAGATGSVRFSSGATTSATATFTSATYVWIRVDEIAAAQSPTDDLAFRVWRSAGSGNVLIDRYALIPTLASAAVNANTPFFAAGGREVAQRALMDMRLIPELVGR